MAIRLFFFFWTTCLLGHENWQKTQLIWNFGLVSSCDVGVPPDPYLYFANDPVFNPTCYQNIQRGDIVWVQTRFLKDFYDVIFPYIQNPFVLVICAGDASFPSDCLSLNAFEDLLSQEKVIHIFAQNCDYQGPSKKVSPIPIGIDFHTIGYSKTGGWGVVGSPKQQEEVLFHCARNALPTQLRKCRAFVDFHHSDTLHGDFQRYLQFGEDRRSIFALLLDSGVIDHDRWMPRNELWAKKIQYAFSISPHGNGLDCHRTWEDLALGCIVIVKSSPLNSLYEGLPVVIIEDWKEIHEENLKKWLLQYGDASTNSAYRKKLTLQYWLSKIHDAAKPYKNRP